jgi:hypothetical protein
MEKECLALSPKVDLNGENQSSCSYRRWGVSAYQHMGNSLHPTQHDRVQWWDLVTMILKLHVTQMQEKFIATVSFSGNLCPMEITGTRSHMSSLRLLRNTNTMTDIRFEVFTAVTMKNGVFWVVTPCGSCKN